MYYDDYVPSGFVQSAGIEKTDVDVLQEEFPSVPPEKIQKIYIDSGRDIAKSREMLVFETLWVDAGKAPKNVNASKKKGGFLCCGGKGNANTPRKVTAKKPAPPPKKKSVPPKKRS